MKTPRVIPLLVAALSVSACSLSTRPDKVDYRRSNYDTTISINLDRAPPAPLVESPPKNAVAGHFWAPGYWNWQGARYSWVPGNWQPERRGYTHVASHWERRGDRWHFHPARFEEHRAARPAQTRREEDRAPARHIEHRAAAQMTQMAQVTKAPDVRAVERRSESRPVAPSAEPRTDSSPGVRAVERSRAEVKHVAHTEDRRSRSDSSPNVKEIGKSRTEVTQNANVVEKAAPEKVSPAAVRPDEKRDEQRDVQRVGHTTERGDAKAARLLAGK